MTSECNLASIIMRVHSYLVPLQLYNYHYTSSFLSEGVFTLSLTNPIWVVKTRLCLVNTADVPSYMRYRGLSGDQLPW